MKGLLGLAALIATLGATPTSAQLNDPPMPHIDWVQKLGSQVPLDTPFTDSTGAAVRFGDLSPDHPAILVLVYYDCPMLCNVVLSGLVVGLRGLGLEVGDTYDVIVLSIDPEESVELAADKKAGWVEKYGYGDGSGWHFLVGSEESIRSVADAVGFEYTYLPATDEYAHAAGICLLTPGGEVARIFYGTEFAPRDLKFGLMEASDGAIGSPIDKIILRCFHYDPAKGTYGFAIMTAIRILGGLTVLAIGIAIFGVIRFDRRRKRQGLLSPPPSDAHAT
ncbi:MAG TPA: SCO family protein [Planctomycetes bacterium]|nr:SCO family protein [Planctomycetota bacterium]